jgi:[ribosomal protein S5]-alanine N-acetyltransferase
VAQTSERPILYETARVTLRRITADDEEEFTRLARASIKLHRPWIFLPEDPAEFADYLRYYESGEAESTLICVRESGAIAGFVTVNDVVRGAHQRATVGYGVFAPRAGRGYMSEGFGLVFRFAFGDLGLHRLEADIQPGNVASLRFAAKIGFRREGFSPAFIRIDGTWKDHERWAITSDMVMPRGAGA